MEDQKPETFQICKNKILSQETETISRPPLWSSLLNEERDTCLFCREKCMLKFNYMIYLVYHVDCLVGEGLKNLQ